MPRPFRFGLHLWELPGDDWEERVRRYEALGFSSITMTDHVVVPQWDPFVGLGAVAAVTQRLTVGTLVLDMALRNPVLVAKAAATLEQVSGGRLELGLGAGYVAANNAAAGVDFASGADRVTRLEECVEVMRSLWSQPSTTFDGRFVHTAGAPMVAPEPVAPRLLIGGGGPKVMDLGGRVADLVSMIPRQSSGEWSVSDSLPDSTLKRISEKTEWVRRGAEAAGRDDEAVEFNTMVATVVVGDHAEPEIRRTADELDLSVEQLADSSLFLCGNADQVGEHLAKWRDATGLSYFSLFDPGEEQIDWLAEHVVKPLAGA